MFYFPLRVTGCARFVGKALKSVAPGRGQGNGVASAGWPGDCTVLPSGSQAVPAPGSAPQGCLMVEGWGVGGVGPHQDQTQRETEQGSGWAARSFCCEQSQDLVSWLPRWGEGSRPSCCECSASHRQQGPQALPEATRIHFLPGIRLFCEPRPVSTRSFLSGEAGQVPAGSEQGPVRVTY